jgi:hypothetical protein
MWLSRTDVILCAIVMTVVSLNCRLSVLWIKPSVAVSTEAVASSRTRTLLRFRITLPRHTSWRWPTLQFSPFSTTAIQAKNVQHHCVPPPFLHFGKTSSALGSETRERCKVEAKRRHKCDSELHEPWLVYKDILYQIQTW